MDDLVQTLNQSLSVSWLILVILLLRFPLKRAPKWTMGVLWGFVAIRLVFPFSWESTYSLVPEAQFSVAEQMASDLTDFSQSTALALSGGGASHGNGGVELNWGRLWFLGFCAMLLYMLISYFRLHRKVREAVPVPDSSQRCSHVSERLDLRNFHSRVYLPFSIKFRGKSYFLRKRVRETALPENAVWLCDGISTPFILGFFQGKIYLPSSISEEDRKYVLAHERAHLERRDHQWKILGFLILAIYWFHPLVWLAYVFFCKDLELACDEKVIRQLGTESKKPYCHALINCSAPRKTISACPLAFGENGVKERVKSVLHYRQPGFWVVLGAAAVCVVTAACLLTDPFRITSQRILEEDGYAITDQRPCTVMLSISKEQIPEDAYTQEGHTFGKDEVIAYQDETTTIYLESIQLANEGPEFLYLIFNTSYDLPESGSILSTVYKNSDGSYRSDSDIRARSLRDDRNTYEDAVGIRSEGPAQMFTFYAETDVFKQAEGTVQFDHYCNQITYRKDGK